MTEEKICFIIMPISDAEGYPIGHFTRVYEHLIKPACSLAGFKAIRADDVQTTNMIALDIVKQIIKADMALCDLSARNPNVLYELGLRQAFNKPVTLIKDSITPRIFDISGFRDVSYDESLRIDTVQASIENISETLRNTYENNGKEINSLTSLLGVEPAKVEKVTISNDTELIINTIKSLENNIKGSIQKAILADVIQAAGRASRNELSHSMFLNGDELKQALVPSILRVGDKITYPERGEGTVIEIAKASNGFKMTVHFNDGSTAHIPNTDFNWVKLN